MVKITKALRDQAKVDGKIVFAAAYEPGNSLAVPMEANLASKLWYFCFWCYQGREPQAIFDHYFNDKPWPAKYDKPKRKKEKQDG